MTEAHSHAKRLFNATKMVAAYSAHTVCMCLAFVTILPGPSSHATLNGREFVLSPRVYLLSWLFFLLAWLPLLFTKQFRWQYGLSGTVTLGVFQAAFWMWAQVAVR